MGKDNKRKRGMTHKNKQRSLNTIKKCLRSMLENNQYMKHLEDEVPNLKLMQTLRRTNCIYAKRKSPQSK